ncbi:MAG: hypothetical protein IPK16_13520 [Anaerolineales bacterium]|nr:hypothetical protein [Anaerolineales bacterium]
MSVNKWLMPVLALILLLGTVGVAQATGWWVVSGREMVDVEQLTGGVDVKGWMTLAQVASGTCIEVATLYEKLGLPADIPPETALKDMEGIIEGFEVTNVRTVVDEALGLAPATDAEAAHEEGEAEAAPITKQPAPATVASPTPVPTEAEPTPAPTPATTVEHTPAGEGSGTGSGTGTVDGETPPAVTSALDIKGRHTLQEIADATEVELSDLLAALNLPPDTSPTTAVRDLVESGKITEIDEVRGGCFTTTIKRICYHQFSSR